MQEVVSQSAIPEKYVLHNFSLEILMERGFREDDFLQSSTAEVRRCLAKGLQRYGPWEGPLDIGYILGFFARDFGSRAPLEWFSRQILRGCVRVNVVDDDVFRLNFAHGHTEMVGSLVFRDFVEGIETSIYYWWCAD